MASDGMQRSAAGAVKPGMKVVTRDGDDVGEVKEIREPYFKVAVSMRPDYWFQLEVVRVNADGEVVTEFAKDDLDDYKVEDIDAAESDAATRTDYTLEGESPTAGTDMVRDSTTSP